MSTQLEFVRSMVEQGVLLFGDFKLKSGGQTPYFFNLGNVRSGPNLLQLGRSYAQCILDNNLKPDVIFGPAYKGISLSVVTAVGLAEKGVEVGIAYNRKEVKDRGEGGLLIGTEIEDKEVLIIDDVIVNGAAKIESAEIIKQAGGRLMGVLIAIDRCEYLDGDLTAAEELSGSLGVGIHAVANLHDVVAYLQSDDSHSIHLATVMSYASLNCKGFQEG